MQRLRPSLIALIALLFTSRSGATPFFARAYGFPCATCHSGFPRLNAFGLAFKANNFRVPGAEKTAPMAWQKTIPISPQVQPQLLRTSPGGSKVQFTDTQILAGGLLSRTTAFYLHHTYSIDATPVGSFPTYELWVQQVLNEPQHILLKGGVFELPFAYSPSINRTTIATPLALGAGFYGNDVRLGPVVSGLQLSGVSPERVRWYLAAGEPGALTSGNIVGERQFFGRFRDIFVRLAAGAPEREVGAFAYFTNPPRRGADPSSFERGVRLGIDGALFLGRYQIHGLAVYGENTDPRGVGNRGTLRSGFVEVDRMLLPWLGLTGRWEAQAVDAGAGSAYRDAKTISVRVYPIDRLRLAAEYQDLDHGRSGTAFMATVTF